MNNKGIFFFILFIIIIHELNIFTYCTEFKTLKLSKNLHFEVAAYQYMYIMPTVRKSRHVCEH